jgi:hypothetical protein
MRAATIYERDGKVYVHSSSKTTVGLWVMNVPVFSASTDNVAEIGRSIRECLAASREGIPHPKSFPTNLFDPVLDLAGVESYATFVQSTKCVEIESEDDRTVTFVPTRNEGPEEGFAELTNTVEITFGSDNELGSAALAALEMSE